jgi:hypothetical protein
LRTCKGFIAARAFYFLGVISDFTLCAPIFGIDAPIFGIDAPIFGIDAPIFGIDAPIFGIDAPIYGNCIFKGSVHTSGVSFQVEALICSVTTKLANVHSKRAIIWKRVTYYTW